MKYFSHYVEESQTIALDNAGAFFAFGQQQFDDEKKEGVKYVNMGHGLFCPKENMDKLLDDLEAAVKNGIKLDVVENGCNAIIEREYFNYETQISCDNSDALDSLKKYQTEYPEQFTNEIINSVFKCCFQKAIDNDWF